MSKPRGRGELPFQLQPGEMYRISYAVGGPSQRRLTRSLVIFGGHSERRQWDGAIVPCLDFARPQGRPLSLLHTQLIDARSALLNEHGNLVLADEQAPLRRRLSRRRRVSTAV